MATMVGVIGGSGLGAALGAVGGGQTHDIDTPYGKPSSPITVTQVAGVPVALLARHGIGHVHSPTQIPVRANIWALKKLGVTHILAGSAVGSLREEIEPRQLVVPDQIIDKTYRRTPTFFDDVVVHAEFAQPFCPNLRKVLLDTGRSLGKTIHEGGTYVCMEGPAFSTRAESLLHVSWGAHLIGMTLMPEAKLAREAEICYAALCLPTDYDCWRPHVAHDGLLAEIIGNLNAATANALDVIRSAVPAVGNAACGCQSSLKHAVWTDRTKIPADVKAKHALLLGKYL